MAPADPGNRLLHIGIDVGQHTPRLHGGGAGEPAKGQRHRYHRRGHEAGDERQRHADGKENREDEHDQQQLTHQVEGQRYNLREILRVGGHPADNFPGRIFVIKGHVPLEHSIEGVFAQVEHHIADNARRVALANKVEDPGEGAGRQDGADDQPQLRCRPVHRQLVDAARNEQRQHRIHGRIEDDHPGHQRHLPAEGAKVGEDAAHQLAVRIVPVVAFGIQPIHQKTHEADSFSPVQLWPGAGNGWLKRSVYS
jgi:hypothetical protein